jgi:hypothetical protein
MISMDKRYRTRDGRGVRVLCVDRDGSQPVCVLVRNKASEQFISCNANGSYFENEEENDLDLIEIPELEFDWSCLPKWAMFVFRSSDNSHWIWSEDMKSGGNHGSIPAAYAPRYHGGDPAPIFQRPTEEAQ